MRRTRGILFILIGLILALGAAYMVLNVSKQQAVQAVASPTPIPKSYVVVAARDLPENAAVSSDDLTKQELPTDLAPPGAIAAPEIAVGKYTTTTIYKGEIIVAPLLADNKRVSLLAQQIPDGKVAMAVTVNDTLNSLGVLRPGDHVDIVLTLDLESILPQTPTAGNAASRQQNGSSSSSSSNGQEPQGPIQKSTQLTIQNVQILAVGAPAGDTSSSPSPSGQQTPGPGASPTPRPTPAVISPKTLTFLLSHQDAVTLKFIKDSGGSMDLVLRSPTDNQVAETHAETLDNIYREFHFKFAQPVTTP